jgi:hypothetical protein
MPNFVDTLKRYSTIFGKGLIQQMVPGMAAGLIADLFEQWNVDVAKVTSDIQNNRSLWARLEDEQKQQLAFAAQRVGSLDFITPEFFINAIKKDFPAVASLFLNWDRAGNWLERQIQEIKTEIARINSVDIDRG